MKKIMICGLAVALAAGIVNAASADVVPPIPRDEVIAQGKLMQAAIEAANKSGPAAVVTGFQSCAHAVGDAIVYGTDCNGFANDMRDVAPGRLLEEVNDRLQRYGN